MIVVDSNVLSELTASRPNSAVVDWFARFGPVAGLPTVVVAEVFAGAELSSDPVRKAFLKESYAGLVELMKDRILSFDLQSAMEYATLTGECRRAGAALKAMDGQVAAIARAHRAAVATRNIRDFAVTGVKLINPWKEQ